VNGNVHYGVIEMASGAVITGKLIPLGGTPAGPVEIVAVETPAESDPEVAAAKSRA
jgi:cytoskeletal protein CcmA (bactofilin family)